METLFTVLALAVLLPMIAIVINYFIKEVMSDTPSVSKFLDPIEIEEAKKYAMLFGLDNEHDINVQELITMGRKYAAYLGNDRIDEMTEEIKSVTKVCYVRRYRKKGIYHNLKHMIQVHSLIERQSFIVLTKKISGGDKDGEPTTISSHRAA